MANEKAVALVNAGAGLNHAIVDFVKPPFTQVTETLSGTHHLTVTEMPVNVENTPSPTHEQMLRALLSELQPINFRERAGLSDGQTLTAKHHVVITVEETLCVAKNKMWSMCFADGCFFVYNGEFWKQLQKQELLHFLGAAAERLGMETYSARYHSVRNDLLKQFHATAYLPKPDRKSDEVLINLANGTYTISLNKQVLRSFNRNDFLRYQLPFAFDPLAHAPTFRQYLDRVLPDGDKQKILAEFIGSVFIRQSVLKLEKSLILYGEGGNGKSVFFEIVKALLGTENISHYSLQSLTNESGYYRAKLSGKLLNYASEISPHMASAIFKQLVSGEPVEARLPYGEPFVLEDYARLVFNTNVLPKDVEQTDAFFRRFLILDFDVKIPEEERDPQLATKIIAAELPGVFNWVLEGLQRLLTQGKLTYSSSVEHTVSHYRQQSDSVQLFFSDEDYQISNEKVVSLKTMYTEYRIYSQESGYRPVSLKVFADRLRNLGYDVVRRNKGNVVGAMRKVV